MILLGGLLEVLFRAFLFIGLALSVGGIIFRYFVLRPLDRQAGGEKRAASLIAAGAFTVAFFQLGNMISAVWSLADQLGHWPLAAFASTGFARAGTLQAGLAFCLGLVALNLRRYRSSAAWGTAAFLAALVVVSGAWLVHAASWLEHRALLMSLTVLHQVAAGAWIGGIMHLTAQWGLLRNSPQKERLWPELPSRFSPLALGSAAVLIAAGVYVSREYIDSFAGLVGTSYGTMLITKIVLMGSVLLLGGINYLTLRQWKMTGDGSEVLRRIPALAELEAGIGATILMAAAAFTSQPPAVDVQADRATPVEVLHVFTPKMPQLTPMPYAKILAASSSSLDLYATPSEVDKVQSDFNHNISGMFVILLGLGAFVYKAAHARWARHWPLVFIPFAFFLLVFAVPSGWPLGNEGFWDTLVAPDVLTHRLATLLVAALGLVIWRSESSPVVTRWNYVFPLLTGAGGAFLLTHSHSIFALKWAFLIEASHNAIAILGILMGAAGWLELRLPGPEGRVAGLVWPVCLTLVGVALLFYREI